MLNGLQSLVSRLVPATVMHQALVASLASRRDSWPATFAACDVALRRPLHSTVAVGAEFVVSAASTTAKVKTEEASE